MEPNLYRYIIRRSYKPQLLLIALSFILGLALICALIMDSGVGRLRKVFRVGIFLPYAVPSVVAALMWGYLYGPTFGPFTQVAHAIGVSAPNLATFSRAAELGNFTAAGKALGLTQAAVSQRIHKQ